MHYDVIIVGAGPAGLACALKLASDKRLRIAVIERSPEVGYKVCAGGITWSGLLRLVPEDLIERSFPDQHVYSVCQKTVVSETKPIIATVNRRRLGLYMAQSAAVNGVTIKTSCSVRKIAKSHIEIFNKNSKQNEKLEYSYLVGADGSSSKVRRHLGLPVESAGIGINYQVDLHYNNMEWHLNYPLFKNGYGWIFPHKNSTSAGAYVPYNSMSALNLKNLFCKWAEKQSLPLGNTKCESGIINYDYRGYHFGSIFLAGDAAGMASALTGEGIYPAILSGEAVAEIILAPDHGEPVYMTRLLEKHRKFCKMVELTSRNSIIAATLAELGVAALRSGLLDFTQLEMGN